MVIKVNEKIAEKAILGGAFFGGGGGGSIEMGRKYANKALELGEVIILGIEEVEGEGRIVTCSIVGAPSSKEACVTEEHMARSCELLREGIGEEIVGFISSENGGTSTVNGWIQAAALGIPIIDAPADGRAHPTGKMGSLGLHRISNYLSIQAGAGGDKSSGKYVEVLVKGSIDRASKVIREAAVQAGGLISVARNPVDLEYLKKNAAVGAISDAISVGEVFLNFLGDLDRICEELGRRIGAEEVGEGEVSSVSLESKGGFDVGKVKISGKDSYEITFWNEYMVLRRKNEVLASFPDLIVLLSYDTSLPVTSAEISKGAKVKIVKVSKERLKLGAGVKDPEALQEVERAIGEKLR